MNARVEVAQAHARAGTWIVPRRLALGAVVGPIMFTAAWIILGFVSPGYVLFGTSIAPYSAISQPISGLGLGITAPFMNAAFIVCGVLMVVGAVGVFAVIPELGVSSRRWCTALLVLPGLGSILDGVFTLESMLLHFVGFVLALTCIVSFGVAGLVLRRIRRWRRFGTVLMMGSPLTLVLAILFFASFDPQAAGEGIGVAGLTERALIVEIHACYAALGWTAVHPPSG